jgi:hypothetical protein
MKTSMVVLYVLVSLSLLFSLTALTIVAGDSFLFPFNFWSDLADSVTQAAETPLFVPAPTPAPTYATAIDNLTYSYQVLNQNNYTHVFTINLKYQGQKELTLNYSQFSLALTAYRNIFVWYRDSALPENSGVVTLSPSHQTETIQLTFNYEQYFFNGMDTVGVCHELHVNP